jgi:ABC-type polysaccharide/polyol phosphate transport system ATPase subunit
MALAIRAEGLGKRFRVGPSAPYGSLRESLTAAFTSPRRLFARAARGGPTRDDCIWALSDVSFEVSHGEVVGIVGRNGSGKSTLLKILSRITEPTAGSAEVHGRIGSLLEVGTGFHPELTGRENVFVNGAILGMRRAEIVRRFDEIVAFAEVTRFIDTPVKHYSSGMQMRLAFAVAAHLEPEILLVDEVLAVGDVAFQRKCLGKMDDVSRKGRTVLFVSHQMNQIRRLCGRSLWLEGGRVVRNGPTAEVASAYEASFMDTATSAEQVGHSPGAAFLTWTLGEGAGPCHALDTFGRITARFTLRVDRAIHGGHHGIALYDSEGRVMWGSQIDDVHLEPGLHEVVYHIDSLPLKPGPYRWHVSIFGPDRFINNLDCVPEMSVVTTPLGHRRDEYAGLLNLPHTVLIRRAAAPDPGAGDHCAAVAEPAIALR